jgi:hypothetical protein
VHLRSGTERAARPEHTLGGEPRPTLAPPAAGEEKREGLSLQTLVIASVASGIAAIVVSNFWRGGTFAAAAVTPVIVAVLSEMLRRPLESELVRRPARRVSEVGVRVADVRGTKSGEPEPPPARADGQAAAPTGPLREQGPRGAPPGGPPTAPIPDRRPQAEPAEPVAAPDPGAPAPGAPAPPGRRFERDEDEAGPVRTYGRPRRRLHLRIALITGAIAFLIAAVAITVPELIFGGSVTGDRKTTLLGGRDRDAARDAEPERDADDQLDSESRDDPSERRPPPDEPSDRPRDEEPAPDERQPEPSQPPPSGEPPPQQPQTPAPPSAPVP